MKVSLQCQAAERNLLRYGMATNLERVDQQLVNIQVELRKLEIIVDHFSRQPATSDRGLVDTVQHHREALLGSSRAITQKIERICLVSD